MISPARSRIVAMMLLAGAAFGAGAAIGAVTPEVHDQPAPTEHHDHERD